MLSRQPGLRAPDEAHEARCSICAHPERSEIDRHLLQSSVRATAARFGLSKSAVQRHMKARRQPLVNMFEPGRLLEVLTRLHAETVKFYNDNVGVDDKVAAMARTILDRQAKALNRTLATTGTPRGVPPGQLNGINDMQAGTAKLFAVPSH